MFGNKRAETVDHEISSYFHILSVKSDISAVKDELEELKFVFEYMFDKEDLKEAKKAFCARRGGWKDAD